MSDQFVGEIRMFAGNFAPTGWALCNGQLLPISQNTALFSLLGTYYGGDGKTTFALPDLQGRAPIQQGQGPGLTFHDVGESGGQASVALTSVEMPSHSHSPLGYPQPGANSSPTNNAWAISGTGRTPPPAYFNSATNLLSMRAGTIGVTGSGQAHNNRSPFLAVTFIIALQGIFPPRG
jgi:microcystin-dependent protein